MIRETKVQTRPHTGVEFFTPRPSKVSYTMDNFVYTAKLIITNSISEDSLVKKSIWTWLSQQDFDLYNQNEFVQIAKQEEQDYIKDNNITLTINIEQL